MKFRMRFCCLVLVLALDICLGRAMVQAFSEAQETAALANGGDRKEIALTFDDGPHSVYTPMLLDGLRERGVHVTFFLLGENIDGKEAIVRQMKEDGHLIGNHGYTHVQMSKESAGAACGQIEMTNQKIEAITGVRPQYLRPPFGSWNEELECATDMSVVLWSIDPLDWKSQNTAKVVRHIVKNAEPGRIILLHDVFPTSVKAALEVVDTLTKQGYTFVTVEELLVD